MVRIRQRLNARRSIKWNMAIAFSFLLFLSVNAVGYLSYYKYSEGAEENAKNYAYDIVRQVSRNAEYYIRYMEDISTLTYFNKDIQHYLTETVRPDDYSQQIRRSLERVKIAEYFKSFLSIRQDIVSIYIFANNGEILTNQPDVAVKDYIDIEEQPWYVKAKEAGGSVVVSPTHVRNFMEGDYRWVASLSREIRHIDTKKSLGVFLIDLNFNVIKEICDNVELGNRSGYIFIVDRDGELVYHPNQQLIYSKVKEEDFKLILDTEEGSVLSSGSDRKKLYTVTTSAITGWKTVGVTYTDELVPNKIEFRNYIIALSIISLPLTFLLATVVASRISGPIKRLERTMREVERGKFDVELRIEGGREVVQLGHTFQIMLKRIRELMAEVVEQQELKRKSELKALQAQINPHFLYNTLDSAIWMTQRGKSQEVIRLIASLSRLFRLSISKGEEWITVKDELEHVKHYLLIQQLRYKHKLEFVLDVSQEMLKYKMPRLILQPLVENAIYHGIKPRPEGGCIIIRGFLRIEHEQREIILEVSDDGVGMPKDKLERIFEGVSSKLQEGGVGVRNVQERIALYAGEQYGLEFRSEQEAGTTVRVRLPVVAQ